MNVNRRVGSITHEYRGDLLEVFNFIDLNVRKFLIDINYDQSKGNTAADSLLCRNIILWIDSELSTKNNQRFNSKVSGIYKVLMEERVKEAFKNKKFIKSYWNSKVKVYYVVIMRTLIKYNLNFLSILLAVISNKIR